MESTTIFNENGKVIDSKDYLIDIDLDIKFVDSENRKRYQILEKYFDIRDDCMVYIVKETASV